MHRMVVMDGLHGLNIASVVIFKHAHGMSSDLIVSMGRVSLCCNGLRP